MTDDALEAMRAIPGVERVERSGGRVVVHGPSDRLLAPILTVLEEAQVPFHDLQTEQSNLEDVFLALTGQEMRD
jgi:hypothetical protein